MVKCWNHSINESVRGVQTENDNILDKIGSRNQDNSSKQLSPKTQITGTYAPKIKSKLPSHNQPDNQTVKTVTILLLKPKEKEGGGMPEHPKYLYGRSIEHLDPQEQGQLADLLIEYEDVFARSEFDLGNFTKIEHSIDTGTAKPIKQRMRRTPSGFANEEAVRL